MSTIATYQATGMTCGHCMDAVSTELRKVPGVQWVNIDLKPGAVSTVDVTSDSPLDDAAVSAAIDEAGYALSQG